MLKCIAIDDEPLALRQLQGYIAKINFLKLEKAFTNAIEAQQYLAGNPIDLIFVDINMPDLSGVEFVRSLVSRPMIIFTTAYSEYAVEGFKLDAIDYLLKPFSFADFNRSVTKAQSLYELLAYRKTQGDVPAPEATPAIQDVADQLKAYPGPYTLMISGHTSSLGSASHNHTLSKRRADAVAKLLVAAGIPSDRIFTVGRGPEVPIADNKTREGQSRNRRVEIEVKAADPSVQKTRTDTSLVDGAQPLAPKAIAKPKK